MGPPRPPPTRIIVDEFGREYIEPPRPPMRQSAAPAIRQGEPEVVYDRAPPRAVSRLGRPEGYAEEGVVYAGSPATYGMARRVSDPARIRLS